MFMHQRSKLTIALWSSYTLLSPTQGCVSVSWLTLRTNGSSPLGSSACLASLRRAAANPEFADWATAFPLVSGLRGLTVAVLRVAVEIIPNDGDLLDSWFIPEEERVERVEGRDEK